MVSPINLFDSNISRKDFTRVSNLLVPDNIKENTCKFSLSRNIMLTQYQCFVIVPKSRTNMSYFVLVQKDIHIIV